MVPATELPVTGQRQQTYQRALEFAQRQVLATIDQHPDYFPIYTVGGKWHHAGELWTDWTGGFFGGMLWRFYQRTGDEQVRRHAEHYSKLLKPRRHDRNVHDLGFIFLNTYLPWYRVTGDPQFQEVLIEAGRTLALRFQQKGQYLCSFVAADSLFIDIMMNVPIIFYAAGQTGDAELLQIATAHCRTTRDTIVRADGSTAHEGLFDLQTGAFLKESTHQGIRGDSRWARGLAWSLSGFARVAALTGQNEFLEVAQRNATFWLDHLPEDRVPFWDFDADLSQPPPWGAQKDSSAGAIAAGGLLRLAKLTQDAGQADRYQATALAMLDALCQPEYLAIDDPQWEGILKHGVYHTAKNLGVDESVMWGEFFFVDALTTAVTGAQMEEDPS